MLGVWEKVVNCWGLVEAGGEWWGLVDPPSSSLRRREGLAVASTGCWDGLTGGRNWLLPLGAPGMNCSSAGSCALLYGRGQVVEGKW